MMLVYYPSINTIERYASAKAAEVVTDTFNNVGYDEVPDWMPKRGPLDPSLSYWIVPGTER